MSWRIFFIVAAVFNFVAGIPLTIAPAEMAASLGLPVPDDLMYHRFTGLLVACFGGVYALMASDPMRYRPVLWTGVIGKAGVVIMFTEAFLGGRVPFQAYAVSLGDLAFVIGFVAFLLMPVKKPA